MSTPYRTAALVPTAPTPKPVARRSQAPRRVLLVIGAWAPAHLLLANACSRGFGLQNTFFLVPVALAAFACALHACVVRNYDEHYPLMALLAPSANAQRLLWAFVLLAPIFGVVAYLAWWLSAPEPSGVNPTGPARPLGGRG